MASSRNGRLCEAALRCADIFALLSAQGVLTSHCGARLAEGVAPTITVNAASNQSPLDP